ncbi:ESX-1 secretion-associated protein [Mycobacterium sp. EPG1]|nr:ESX-1 secretion-associated protein [Mycobacterium sp. EPG1]
MTDKLEVDTSELRRAGEVFVSAAEQFAGLQADAPLGEAAAAVPQLKTAAACIAARTTVATEVAGIAVAARKFGADLVSSANEYDATDEDSARNIDGVEIPAPR